MSFVLLRIYIKETRSELAKLTIQIKDIMFHIKRTESDGNMPNALFLLHEFCNYLGKTREESIPRKPGLIIPVFLDQKKLPTSTNPWLYSKDIFQYNTICNARRHLLLNVHWSTLGSSKRDTFSNSVDFRTRSGVQWGGLGHAIESWHLVPSTNSWLYLKHNFPYNTICNASKAL